jgi:hypothetical protein
MAIYRGAGGARDATSDAASEALLIRELAAEVVIDAAAAEAAKVAAEAAKVAAELAETNAETAETNAETAETNAETAQAAAASSATAAASSASAASTSATNAATSATSASGSASAASTSATNAASSASAASTSATNAASSASSASTSATSATNSATSASTSAATATTQATNASNSATAAAGSATSASGSASTATTQAGIATTKATEAAASAAAALTSETNAASSASAASTSASNASTSASSASTSASNAATSASAADASAVSAAASAASAASAYDQFDDRYLGAKSSDPSVDNDGNALVTGALYYNTVDGVMKVYDGGVWIAASAASQAILTVYQYTATAAQTTFTGTDNNSLTLGYTVGSALVTLNGVVLEVGSEVTATSGTSIVLASAASAGDEVNIYAFATFELADVYTKAASDARYLQSIADDSITTDKIADGAVTAEKLGFTLSSNALTQSIPLKSGTTLTAGRAVNVNSSGEVGDYPVVNTLGTPVTNPSINYAATTGGFEATPFRQGWVSTDGSRALTPSVTPYDSPYLQLRGTALTSSGATVGSAVTFTVSSMGFATIMSCVPLNETQFLVASMHTSSTGSGGTSSTYYWTLKVVTVDSSGNISQGTAASFTASAQFWYTKTCVLSKLSDGKIGVYALAQGSDYTNNVSRIATVSGTSVSLTADTDYEFFSTKNSYLTASNKLLGVSGGTLYRCNYDGSTTNTPANSYLLTNATGVGVESVLFDSNFAAVLYKNTSNQVLLESFSINQTTGVPTKVTSRLLTTSTFNISVVRMITMSSTEAVVTYKLGTTTYLLSFKINGSGEIVGTGIPATINSSDLEALHISPTSTANTIRYFINSSTGITNDVAINSYDSPSWVTAGATATSQTTSPAAVVVGGVCAGFSGLTPSSKYYVNETTYDGQITTAIGNYLLGTAISSTEILLG